MSFYKTSNVTTYEVGAPDNTAVVWDDMQVNVGRVRLGASAPTWRTYDHGIGSGIAYDVLGFTVNNYVMFDVQTSHSMLLDSVLDLHIHYVLPNVTDIGDKFQFQLDVIAAGVTYEWAVVSGSPFTSEHTITGVENISHRLLEIAELNNANQTVSSIYTCKLTRIAASSDEYGSEVYIKFIDCHYQKDQIGSRQEYVK